MTTTIKGLLNVKNCLAFATKKSVTLDYQTLKLSVLEPYQSKYSLSMMNVLNKGFEMFLICLLIFSLVPTNVYVFSGMGKNLKKWKMRKT